MSHVVFLLTTTQKIWGYSHLLCSLRAVAIKFVGVPQPKPMHGFSPNLQDELARGSRAD